MKTIFTIFLVLFMSASSFAATVVIDQRPGSKGTLLIAQSPDCPREIMEMNAKALGLKPGEYVILQEKEGDNAVKNAEKAAKRDKQ